MSEFVDVHGFSFDEDAASESVVFRQFAIPGFPDDESGVPDIFQ